MLLALLYGIAIKQYFSWLVFSKHHVENYTMRIFFVGTALRSTFMVLALVSLVACGAGSSKKGPPANSIAASSLTTNSSFSVGSSQKNNSSMGLSSVLNSSAVNSSVGNSNVSTVSNSSISYLIGGSIQHLPLDLKNEVTTFAGAVKGADGAGTESKFYLPEGAVTDGNNLYVADTGNHTIRKIVLATGVVTTLAGKAGVSGSDDGATGSAARFYGPQSITINGTNLFVTDTQNQTIRKIAIASGEVITLAGSVNKTGATNATGTQARFYFPRGITNDGTYLYVTDSENHTIRKIKEDTGEVTTLAGLATQSGNSNGLGTNARFKNPTGIFSNGTNLYVTDSGNHTIRKIVISSGLVETFAGTAGQSGTANGTNAEARFNSPTGITGDGTYLYVSDTENHTIRKIAINSQAVTTLAGMSGMSGSDNGLSLFNKPSGIAIVGSNLYVADRNNNTIRLVSVADSLAPIFAGIVRGGDGSGNAVSFAGPYGMTTDGTNIYFTDTEDSTIRKMVISTGVVSTLAGVSGQAGADDGIGALARFRKPEGITTDGTNLYVTDYGNNAIRKIVIESREVITLAGSVNASGSDDGAGTSALFNAPYGITTDGINLYVADTGNYTIRKIEIATGIVETFAGTADQKGAVDETGTAARFNFPSGITTDGTYLYVTDTNNNTIRKIEIASRIVKTLAGTALMLGSTDEVGEKARFSYCQGISSDGTYLYVVDTGNHTIRRVDKVTGAVTTIAGSAGVSGSVNATGTASKFWSPTGITNDGLNVYVTDTTNNTIRKIH
jgi:hypothetical protein